MGPAWPQVSRGGEREQVTHPQPELHPSPCVPGGYYLTSLSASLALLSGLGQAHTLPLSPSQELQRALSLWEQRRLPATHSFQVTGPPRHPPEPRPSRGKAGPAVGTVPQAEPTAKPALLQRARSTCPPHAQRSRAPALNRHRNAEIGPSSPPFNRRGNRDMTSTGKGTQEAVWSLKSWPPAPCWESALPWSLGFQPMLPSPSQTSSPLQPVRGPS